ncbi:MAG: hypothetical protein LLF76_12830 [Planctomycetaceae bacterium]|nr:hypothetical protein [Planctomycetaceae bacterium]
MHKKKKLRDRSTGEKVISKADRMRRLGACCGVAGCFLACLAALLNYHQHLQPWQVNLLGTILIVCIVIILAYGSVWVWIVNLYQKGKGKR